MHIPEPTARHRTIALICGIFFLIGWWVYALDGQAISTIREAKYQLAMPDHESHLFWTIILFGVPAHACFAFFLSGRGSGPLLRFTRGQLYCVALLALILVRYGLLGGAPLTDDEWAYQFQAATFADFQLWAAPPPDSIHFDYLFLTVDEGRWYCYLQPGLALLMVPGQWLASDGYLSILPIVAAIVPATMTLAGRIAGPEAARMAGLVVLGSPWFLLTAATIEPYGPLAFLLVLILILVHQWLRSTTTREANRSALFLGALMGCLLLLRGLEFGLVGLMLLALFLWRAYRTGDWVRVLLGGIIFLLGLLPFALAQLGYNSALTGHALVPPITEHVGGSYYGFGDDIYHQHSLGQGLRLWMGNLVRMTAWFCGPLWTLLLALSLRRKSWPWVLLMLLWWGAWIPYSMSGVADFGPVYLFALLPILGLVVAMASVSRRTQALLIAGIILNLMTLGPLVAYQAHEITRHVAEPYAKVEAALTAGDKALVLFRRKFPAPTGWVFGLRAPDPHLSDRMIFGWATPRDLRPDGLGNLKQRFPGRRILIVEMSADGH